MHVTDANLNLLPKRQRVERYIICKLSFLSNRFSRGNIPDRKTSRRRQRGGCPQTRRAEGGPRPAKPPTKSGPYKQKANKPTICMVSEAYSIRIESWLTVTGRIGIQFFPFLPHKRLNSRLYLLFYRRGTNAKLHEHNLPKQFLPPGVSKK